jgi:hypothetical protein
MSNHCIGDPVKKLSLVSLTLTSHLCSVQGGKIIFINHAISYLSLAHALADKNSSYFILILYKKKVCLPLWGKPKF